MKSGRLQIRPVSSGLFKAGEITFDSSDKEETRIYAAVLNLKMCEKTSFMKEK